MPTTLPTPLVTTEWLAANLGASDLRIVDASAYLAAAGRDARAEYEGRHIEGAVFADIEADTHLHVHKENNVLFPAVLATEAALEHGAS